MRIVIELDQMNFATPAKKILSNLSFEIQEGSFTVVIGENGSGKTTLLKLLMGLSQPSSGSILVHGKVPSRDHPQDRLKIAYISEKLTPPMDWSASEFFAFNRFFYPHYSIELEAELTKRLRVVRESRLGLLSAGELRRVQVVAALAANPEILFIDEITAVLDIVGRAKFNQILQELRKINPKITILMATNILDDVDEYATHILLLNQGKLKFYTEKSSLLLTRPNLSLTRILAHYIEEDLAE